MTIVGNQFQNIGATTMNIQDITVAGDFDTWGGDWIKFWDPSTRTYEIAYYFGEDADGVFAPEDVDYENSLGAGWGDGDQIILNLDIDLGQGFWTQSVGGGSLVFSGEVTSNTEVTVPANKMTLIANPIPQSINIQDITIAGDFDTWGGDWIKFWDPSTRTYEIAYYFGEDADGVFAPEDVDYENSLGAGWGDGDQIIIDLNIDVGQGFWVQSVNGGSVIFPTVSAE